MQVVAQQADQFKILLARDDHFVVRDMKTNKKHFMPRLDQIAVPKVFDDQPQEETKIVKAAQGETKLNRCRAIFNQNPHAEKAAIIERFVAEVNCTPMGANTYFCLLKKQHNG